MYGTVTALAGFSLIGMVVGGIASSYYTPSSIASECRNLKRDVEVITFQELPEMIPKNSLIQDRELADKVQSVIEDPEVERYLQLQEQIIVDRDDKKIDYSGKGMLVGAILSIPFMIRTYRRENNKNIKE